MTNKAILNKKIATPGKGVGPRQMVDNLTKELKMRSFFELSDAILGVKWAI